MNTRERFHAQMHYQPRDRSVIWDFNFWRETIDVWHEQGLPREITHNYSGAGTDDFFGMDPTYHGMVHVGLCPGFEAKVIEDRGDHEIVQQENGVQVLRKKFMSSIPHHVAHLLTDRQSWKAHYKPRLDPTTSQRHWPGLKKHADDLRAKGMVMAFSGGSLYGWLRDWMGMENLSLVVYDEPAFFEEMVTTVADCIVATLKQAIDAGVRADGCSLWEDMCYNAGPLLSPAHFKKYLVPHYRRITDLMHSAGVDVIWLDCDGNIEQLMPMWLDAGVNCMFPVEIGTWGADPIKYRRQYGKDLLVMGGFDKHILAQSKEAVEREVRRLTPLVEEGGFIGFCDHRVPPDVPLENYIHYIKTVRHLWGRDTDLRPAHPCVA
jgi:uroporphyrinogen decarboxylase